MSTTSLNSKSKVGLFLKRNFHSMNSLIENPTEFKWLGIPFQDGVKENSVKFEAEFNDNSNIEYNSENKEYVWYKNINIPKIKVSQCSFYPVEQLKAEIMVYGGILSGDFQDVPIKGKNFFNFNIRESVLKGIRVGETSHTLKIDTGFLIEPFFPYLLREEHRQNESIQGLFNYLTSKKLRHKSNIAYKIQNLLIKKKLQPQHEEFLIIRVVVQDNTNFKEYFNKEYLIEEYRQKFKDISNIKMKYMKKYMIHPHKLEQVCQDGHMDSSNELSSQSSSGKNYIKDPFSVSIINLNVNDHRMKQNLIKIEAQKC